MEGRREDSEVPAPIMSALEALSAKIPVAVITSKDYHFVAPRTASFARGWACAGGLEVRIRGAPSAGVRVPPIDRAAERLERWLPAGTIIERKTSSDETGTLLGFCVDWTECRDIGEREVRTIANRLKDDGLFVVYSEANSFLDAFASRPDKGKALAELTERLGVKGAVLYMGDSDADNDAFDRSDISVGVDHGQPLGKLDCDYLIDSRDLRAFLLSVLSDAPFPPKELRQARRAV